MVDGLDLICFFALNIGVQMKARPHDETMSSCNLWVTVVKWSLLPNNCLHPLQQDSGLELWREACAVHLYLYSRNTEQSPAKASVSVTSYTGVATSSASAQALLLLNSSRVLLAFTHTIHSSVTSLHENALWSLTYRSFPVMSEIAAACCWAELRRSNRLKELRN